ncbi:MAG TPA: STAS domain-containing protein [Methylocella sp.]|nr:STAS domain-containing protein [Methylocella sp.]
MPADLTSESIPVSALELPRILDLKAATPLAVEMLALRGRALDIDASRVERLGGQCLQVLLSAAKTWRTDEIPFALVNPSSDFSEGLERLGVCAADFTGPDQSQ